jgi:hypothetical protein
LQNFHLCSYHAGAILSVMAHVNTDTIVIRRAVAADLDALRHLAALDSARALLGDVLVAESNGIVRAAYSVDEQRAIADPFVPTAALVTLLETRAAPLREARPKRNRGPSALVRALPARP